MLLISDRVGITLPGQKASGQTPVKFLGIIRCYKLTRFSTRFSFVIVTYVDFTYGIPLGDELLLFCDVLEVGRKSADVAFGFPLCQFSIFCLNILGAYGVALDVSVKHYAVVRHYQQSSSNQ